MLSKARCCLPGPWVLLTLFLLNAAPAWAAQHASNTPPRIAANQNLLPGGELRDGVLKIQLELREGTWYPDADEGPSLEINAFGEEGKAPQIPGPMIRVPEGTEIQASIRNLLPGKAMVFGLYERPGDWGSGLEVAPGEVREVRFRAGAPGTYYYWARTTTAPFSERAANDTQLSGALIVDPRGTHPDGRIFVLGLWYANPDSADFREVLTINGKSWPFTERFTFDQGDRVRWRVVNTSVSDHAMHLHGFFFRVESKGNGARDDIYSAAERRQVGTERIDVGETFRMTWTPHTPGNWLFHCHMLAHMSPEGRLAMHGKTPEEMSHADHALAAGMGGLVIGINVRPKTPPVAEVKPARKLRLLVRERAGAWPFPPGVGFQIQEGDQEPSPNDVPFPGPPLVLTRGEPVEITVVNQLRQPTAVHWHGIELESYYDGVPYLTGTPNRLSPPVPPGESFVARMTPSHAGTYIYHTHWHDEMQLRGGLYGPLIVLEPGQTFDLETDKIFLIGWAGQPGQGRLVVNGHMEPDPVELHVGRRYRLRFINITTNGADLVVTLRDGTQPVKWRALGKDGQGLPPGQANVREARQNVTVGETYDFELQPEKPGGLMLEVHAPFGQRWVITPLNVVR